jgi:hypothetical protein
MRGETVDVSALDDATRSAFSSWKAQHSSDRLASYEPPAASSLAWIASRPSRSSEL